VDFTLKPGQQAVVDLAKTARGLSGPDARSSTTAERRAVDGGDQWDRRIGDHRQQVHDLAAHLAHGVLLTALRSL
jgi:hypothetical protein